MDVTVCIPTVPERVGMLQESLASVYAQTRQPAYVLVRSDVRRDGIQANGQALLDAVTTDWVCFNSDDDLLDPDHLEVLADHSDGVDVVYSYCRSAGPRVYDTYNQPFDPVLLRRRSIVSHTCLFRKRMAVKAGGFPQGIYGEDWRLWNAMLDAGASFRSVPQVTWTYRFHKANMSWSPRGDMIVCEFTSIHGRCISPAGHNGPHVMQQLASV